MLIRIKKDRMKPFEDSLWMDCLFELMAKAKKEGKGSVEFKDVDRLVIEKSKLSYKKRN